MRLTGESLGVLRFMAASQSGPDGRWGSAGGESPPGPGFGPCNLQHIVATHPRRALDRSRYHGDHDGGHGDDDGDEDAGHADFAFFFSRRARIFASTRPGMYRSPMQVSQNR